MSISHIIQKAALCLAFGAAFTSAVRAQSLWMGHAKENAVTYLQVTGGETAGSAVCYPAEVMEAYKGCTIDAIKVNLDGKTPENGARVFITRSLDEAPLLEKTFTSPKSGWQTVTFDTPFTITGEKLYIGYEAQGQLYLPYADPFVSGEEWVKRDGEGWRLYNGRYSAGLLFSVSGNGRSLHDVRLAAAAVPEYVVTGTAAPVTGAFKNLSEEEVTSLTFAYRVGGQTIAEETVGGLSVKPRTEGAFSLQGFTLDKEGEYNVSVLVKAVNGAEDILPDDNESDDRSVVCRDRFLKRNTLLEIFSTEKCSGCPAAHEGIATKLGNRTDIIEIGHHAGFYTDEFTLEESLDCEWFYPTGRLYAPAMMFDRTNFGVELPTVYKDGVPVAQAGGISAEKVYNKAIAIPAVVTLSVKPELDLESRTLALHVEGERLLPVDEKSSVRLFVWLTEDSIFSKNQAGSANGFWQRHVARRSLTPTWGKVIDVTKPFAADFGDIVLPEEWALDKMELVAFVAVYNQEDKNDCRVLNAAAAPLTDKETSGIHTPVTGEKGDGLVTVYNMSGRQVLLNAPVEALSRLAAGVYIVNGRKVVL